MGAAVYAQLHEQDFTQRLQFAVQHPDAIHGLLSERGRALRRVDAAYRGPAEQDSQAPYPCLDRGEQQLKVSGKPISMCITCSLSSSMKNEPAMD